MAAAGSEFNGFAADKVIIEAVIKFHALPPQLEELNERQTII